MPNALALAIQDHPMFRGPEVSIRHDPGYGITPKIVWSEMVQLHSLSATSNDVPDDFFGNPVTPSVPWRLTARKIPPAATFAKSLHRSIACLPQAGTGTVRK
jgi:hypothetical protein